MSSLPVYVNHARVLLLITGGVGSGPASIGSIGGPVRSSVSGAPGLGPMVQTTPKHCSGSALPVAVFPPPSTLPVSA